MTSVKVRKNRHKIAEMIRDRMGLSRVETARKNESYSLRDITSLDPEEKLMLVSYQLFKLEQEGTLKDYENLSVHLVKDIAKKLGITTPKEEKYIIDRWYNSEKSKIQVTEMENISRAEKLRRLMSYYEQQGRIHALIRKLEKELKEKEEMEKLGL